MAALITSRCDADARRCQACRVENIGHGTANTSFVNNQLTPARNRLAGHKHHYLLQNLGIGQAQRQARKVPNVKTFCYLLAAPRKVAIENLAMLQNRNRSWISGLAQ